MKLLIIGSKGFIGSHAYKHFESRRFEVFGCDVSVDYTDENYFQIDGSNSDYHQIFEKINFDICLNCSGAASVPQSLENPLRDFTLNTYNVVKILDAIRNYSKNCRFINLSSAAVYGNPAMLPINENQQTNPISPYGIHKYFAEEICREYFRFFHIKTCSLRIFSAFGNGLKKQLFWDLHQKFENSSVITLFGSGNETRDFIHVTDICSAIECVINNAAFEGEIINIGNGDEIRISEVAEIFGDLAHEEKQIIFNQQTKAGDPKNWKADIDLLKKFGYKKTVSLEKGIEDYIRWAREQ